MLSVGDWIVPVLGYKAGDPAAENDTPDWVTGVVAEEGSKLGVGGEMVYIGTDSSYYIEHSEYTFHTPWPGTPGYKYYSRSFCGYSNQDVYMYVYIDITEITESLSHPVMLCFFVTGVGPEHLDEPNDMYFQAYTYKPGTGYVEWCNFFGYFQQWVGRQERYWRFNGSLVFDLQAVKDSAFRIGSRMLAGEDPYTVCGEVIFLPWIVIFDAKT